MLPKFIEDCNRQLPDGAAEWADSASFMVMYTTRTCRSTVPVRELSANDSEDSDQLTAWSFFESFILISEAKYSFWIKSRTGENTGKFSA